MTYADQAATAADPEFRDRVRACTTQQALIFIDDGRPEFNVLAEQVIHNAGTADSLVPLVAGKPGITTGSGDPDILAAVQAVWPVYGATLIGEEPTP
jgi:hypothetical protein